MTSSEKFRHGLKSFRRRAVLGRAVAAAGAAEAFGLRDGARAQSASSADFNAAIDMGRIVGPFRT